MPLNQNGFLFSHVYCHVSPAYIMFRLYVFQMDMKFSMGMSVCTLSLSIPVWYLSQPLFTMRVCLSVVSMPCGLFRGMFSVMLPFGSLVCMKCPCLK